MKYPIGIQDFRELRSGGYVYVDKTEYIHRIITGVSAFSKVSIFSDLNNLKNLSIHKDASELLGITTNELETYFSSRIQQIAAREKVEAGAFFEKVKDWYNGYSWDGESKLYNPFSLLSFLDGERFHNFWFETGTPTFLVKEMRKQQYYDIDRVEVSESQLSAFDFQNLDPITVLVQTGDYIYALEFKLDQSAEEALRQIKDRGYLSPFMGSPKEKIAVGINFSMAEKRVVDWRVDMM